MIKKILKRGGKEVVDGTMAALIILGAAAAATMFLAFLNMLKGMLA